MCQALLFPKDMCGEYEGRSPLPLGAISMFKSFHQLYMLAESAVSEKMCREFEH